MSAAAFLYAFRSRPPLLMFLVIASVAQIPLFSSNLLAADNLGSIDDPRFLGILAVVPGLHLGYLMRDRSRPLVMNVALAMVQSAIIVFAVWIRASAIWVILSLGIYAGLIAIRGLVTRHNGLRRIWPFAVLLVTLATHMLWVTMTVHPVYGSKGEISRHVFWHAVFYQLQGHPKWNEKYAASYDFAVGDQMPILAAKKYLLRHPPLDPDEVYLTPDRQNVRVAASEASLRKAFFEFFANDPRFVLESLFIYNPLVMYAVFTAYLSSLEQTPAADFIAALAVILVLGSVLAANDERRRVFKDGALLVTGGFIVSLLPILLTAPSIPTMGEQFFVLLITLGCWSVLAVATGLRMILGKRERVTIGPPHAAQLGVPGPTSSLP